MTASSRAARKRESQRNVEPADRHDTAHDGAKPKSAEHKALTKAEVRTIVLGLLVAMFLAAVNQTIVATALPTIGREFRDFENLSWLVTSYLLTSTVAAALYGKLSDIHGRRAMMLAAVGIFMAGSLLCAVAPNMTILIVGRALQGLGGGGIIPLAQAIMADAIAPRERGRYQVYTGIVWVSAGVGGPILGGFLSEHLHWSLIFWLNIPVGIIAALLTHVTLKRLPRHDRPHQLDILGAGLMMAAAVSLLLALTWGGTRYAWLSPEIIFLAAASLLLSLLFSWRLLRAPEPFLPLSVLANPIMRYGTAATATAQAAQIGLTIYIPLYLEVVHKLSATDAGMALIPIVVMTTPGSMLAGRVMMHRKSYKWLAIVGLALSIIALLLLAWQPQMPTSAVAVILAIVGFGAGTVFPIATVSIQNSVSRHQVGVAMGAMNFFRALTSAFLVAAMGAIMLSGFGVAPERGRDLTAIAARVSARGVDVAYVFGWVFAAAAFCLVVGLIALIFMEERPLRGPTPAAQAPIPAAPATPTA